MVCSAGCWPRWPGMSQTSDGGQCGQGAPGTGRGVACLTKYGSSPLPSPLPRCDAARVIMGKIYASSVMGRQEKILWYRVRSERARRKMSTQWKCTMSHQDNQAEGEELAILHLHTSAQHPSSPRVPPSHSATFPCQEKTESLCYQTAVTHCIAGQLPGDAAKISDGDNGVKMFRTGPPPGPRVTYCPLCAASPGSLGSGGSCSSCLGRLCDLSLRPGAGDVSARALVVARQSVVDSVQCHWRIVTPVSAGSRSQCSVSRGSGDHWTPVVSLAISLHSPRLLASVLLTPLLPPLCRQSFRLWSSSQLRVIIAPPLLPSALRLHPPSSAGFEPPSLRPFRNLGNNDNAEEKGRESLCRKSVLNSQLHRVQQ